MEFDEYVAHLVAGRQEACLAEGKSRASDVAGLHRLFVSLIQPSQYRIGELWEQGKVSVATEHLATAINTFVAAACYAPLASTVAGGPKAIVACASDELHEFGPRLLADLLDCDGWDVDFFGPSMPLRDLIAVVDSRKPRFVGLSAALVMHLGNVKTAISSIRAELGQAAPPLFVGGNAFAGDASLWIQVGADGYARDASQAIVLVRDLQT